MRPAAGSECAGVLAHIEDYVDGELGEVECRAIDEHCARCEECAGIVRRLRATLGLCREVGRAPLPASVRLRARAQVKRLLSRPRISAKP